MRNRQQTASFRSLSRSSRSGKRHSRFGVRVATLSAWIIAVGISGCCLNRDKCNTKCAPCPTDLLTPTLQGPQQLTPEDPVIRDCGDGVGEILSPNQITDYSQVQFHEMTLEACVAEALQNSKVMRDLGVTILRSSNSLITPFDPAITYTDPRLGEEAALSRFDANVFANASFEKNDHVSNNQFLGNLSSLQQDLHQYRYGVQKTTATGTNFRLSNTTIYDFNNQLGNIFGSPSSSWDTYFDAEFRQPLLQGGGLLFNRIAGPGATPGVYNGVLLARANTDISLAKFEQGVQEFLSNVENAYWDLYYAYRDLEAKVDARNEALETWKKIASRGAGPLGAAQGAETQEIAQAEEQYFRFDAEVIDALSGRLIEGTRTSNGATGGSFRAIGGVRVAERRLRLIIGWPINGEELIRPSDVPVEAAVRFDWNESVEMALRNRPELRQQAWSIKRSELQYLAAKNFLLPRFDLVGRYRFRGFGKNLTGSDDSFAADRNNSSAWADLYSGDHQEWQVGAEFSMPLGFRQGFAAVRNGELTLARERAVFHEQKREVMLGLSNSVGELKHSFDAKMAALNRLKSAEKLRDALEAVSDVKNAAPLDVQLEAQRRVADAKIQYYRTQVEYMLAIKNVHHERSSLLSYYNIALSESASSPKAYADSSFRDSLRRRELNYVDRDLTIATPRVGGSEGGFSNLIITEPVRVQPAPAGESKPGTSQAPAATPLNYSTSQNEWLLPVGGETR